MESAKDRNQKIKEITDKLESGIKELYESDRFKNYLTTMSKFYNYSFNNSLLIMMQKPESTHVAGFKSWQTNFNRNVKKGEKGITILAPAPYRFKMEMDRIDPATQKPELDENGKPVKELVEVTKPAFMPVYVFDVSQTDGEPLPEITHELTGNVERYTAFIESLKKVSPFPIEFEDIKSGAKGYCNAIEGKIAVKSGMSEKHTIKTMIHEITHADLHTPDTVLSTEVKKDRHTKEVEAESVAYVVCSHYEIDTSDYSFAYIAGWSHGKELNELKSSLDTIQKQAADLIDKIDSNFKELLKEQEKAALDIDIPENSAALYGEQEQALFKIENRGYLFLQTSDNGYDYTLSDNSFNMVDGGQLDSKTSIAAAKSEILASFDISRDEVHELSIDEMKNTDTPYRVQVQAIYEYEVNNNIPEPDRMTAWYEEMDVSVAKPYFKDRQGISEAAISKRYEEITNVQKYTIYQLSNKDENTNRLFVSYDGLKRQSDKPNLNNYQKVYSGTMKAADNLENLYVEFNINRPEDFYGHSMSVSDVIVIENSKEATAHYVDSFGYVDCPELAKQHVKQKGNTLDEQYRTEERLQTTRYDNEIDLDKEKTSEQPESKKPKAIKERMAEAKSLCEKGSAAVDIPKKSKSINKERGEI